MLNVLNKFVNDTLIDEKIRICKSDSGVNGVALRKAHEFLGEVLAINFKDYFCENLVAVAFLRAGLPFAYGFANALDCPFLLFNDKNDDDFFKNNSFLLTNKKVVFIDAVINSGEAMLKAVKKSNLPKNKITIVTNVLSQNGVNILKDYDVFTVRISTNSFKGAKVLKQENGIGPDTGDRLFKTI